MIFLPLKINDDNWTGETIKIIRSVKFYYLYIRVKQKSFTYLLRIFMEKFHLRPKLTD